MCALELSQLKGRRTVRTLELTDAGGERSLCGVKRSVLTCAPLCHIHTILRACGPICVCTCVYM